MKKRILSIVLAGAVVFSGLLTGCGATDKKQRVQLQKKKPQMKQQRVQRIRLRLPLQGL